MVFLQLNGDSSDMDEPMASQSADSEAPLTHNSSKNNFFAMGADEQQGMQLLNNAGAAPTGTSRGSFKVCLHSDGDFNNWYTTSLFL